jgi:hypothetical protein
MPTETRKETRKETKKETTTQTTRRSGSLPRVAARCLFLGALVAAPGEAALLLTEIHYNGPAAGADPDEFIELTNAGDAALSLEGFGFSAGIDFSFPPGTLLSPWQSLVLARDSGDFLAIFSDVSGALFDYDGALSNGGETLTLAGIDGLPLWSVSYDDAGAWPRSADGDGNSLQLLPGAADVLVGVQLGGTAPLSRHLARYAGGPLGARHGRGRPRSGPRPGQRRRAGTGLAAVAGPGAAGAASPRMSTPET